MSARAFVRSHGLGVLKRAARLVFRSPNEKLPSFLGSSDFSPGEDCAILMAAAGVSYLHQGWCGPCVPQGSERQFMRLLTWSSSEPCCDPHLGLWVNLGLFLLLNLHAGVARGLDLWRNRNLRVLLDFQARLACGLDLRLNGCFRGSSTFRLISPAISSGGRT